MENSKLGTVKIIADAKTGLVVNMFPNNTKGEAYFTIEQRGIPYFDAKGYYREPLRVCRMRGKFEQLLARKDKAGDDFGGTIIRKDSFSPFYTGQKPTMNPSTEKNVLKDGKETYFQYVHIDLVGAKDYWVTETTEVSETTTTPELAKKLVAQE